LEFPNVRLAKSKTVSMSDGTEIPALRVWFKILDANRVLLLWIESDAEFDGEG
jgi:hypothetical protein